MTLSIFLVLTLLVAVVVVFSFEWVSVDMATLILLAILVLSGILTVDEAFSGFSNEIIVILAAIFVLSGALMKGGVLDHLSDAIHRGGQRLPAVRRPGAVLDVRVPARRGGDLRGGDPLCHDRGTPPAAPPARRWPARRSGTAAWARWVSRCARSCAAAGAWAPSLSSEIERCSLLPRM
jgi:hypothetical protein